MASQSCTLSSRHASRDLLGSAPQRRKQRGILQRWSALRKRIVALRLWHTAVRHSRGQGRNELFPPVPDRDSQATESRPPRLETHGKALLRNGGNFLAATGQHPLSWDDAVRR